MELRVCDGCHRVYRNVGDCPTCGALLKLADETFFVGQTFGKYRIDEVLGEGGMGVVYRATHTTLDRPAALKIVQAPAEDERFQKRFLREARILAALKHPSIVEIYDFDVSPEWGVAYYVMEFLEGGNLREIAHGLGGTLAPEIVSAVLRPVGAGLSFAHRKGIVHRDLKPDNVFIAHVDGRPVVKLLDFGLAKITATAWGTAQLTGTGMIVGTPDYLAPEQILGDEIGPPADQYALALVTVELFAGRSLRHGMSVGDIFAQIEEPFGPERLPQSLPAATRAALLQALDKDPAARYWDVAAFIEALALPDARPGEARLGEHLGFLAALRDARRNRPAAPAKKALPDMAGETSQSGAYPAPQEPASPPALPDPPERAAPRPAVEPAPDPPRPRVPKGAPTVVAPAPAVLPAAKPERSPAAVAVKGVTRTRRVVLGALLAAAVAAAAVGLLLARRAPGPRAAASGGRRSLAAMGFRNASGRSEVAWLSTALSEMLASELAAGGSIRAVPGEEVARVRVELGLGDGEEPSKATLQRIHRSLGADLVMVGTYTALGESAGGALRLDIRLQDGKLGETLAAVALEGTQERLFDLVSRAGAQLRQGIGVGAVPASQVERVRQTLPRSAEAAQLYADGLARLRLFEARRASELLERAAKIEPGHPLTHWALSSAFSALGYDARAAAEAKAAFDLSAGLSREERILIEAGHREATGDRRGAVKLLETLHTFFPEDPDYGLRLAAAQTAAGLGSEALATIEALRRELRRGADPRLDLAEARAADALADYLRQQAAAASAAAASASMGASLLLAQARLLESKALLGLGEPQKALQACEEARQLFTTAGDFGSAAAASNACAAVLNERGDLAGARLRYGEALAAYRGIGSKSGIAATLNNLAGILVVEGNLAEARALYQESLAIRREVGNRIGLARSLNNLANVLLQQGDVAGAENAYEEATTIYRETGNRTGLAEMLNNSASILTQKGDLAGARRHLDESLAISRAAGHKSDVALSQCNLAALLLRLGDLAAAVSLLEESGTLARGLGNKSLQADTAFVLGEARSAQGDLDAARKLHDQALALRRELGEKSSAAESQLALARLGLEDERRLEDSETLARQALAELEKERSRDLEGAARAVLARCLLAEGKPLDALGEAAKASSRLGEGGDRGERLGLALTRGRIDAALGRGAEALRSVSAAEEEASRAGFAGLALEARLALGELELRSGGGAAGRARLQALEKDAGAKGFGLVERRARTALAGVAVRNQG